MAEAAGPGSPHIELTRYPQRASSGGASVARFSGYVESAIAAAVVQVDRPDKATRISGIKVVMPEWFATAAF
jgi:hypothetical protein